MASSFQNTDVIIVGGDPGGLFSAQATECLDIAIRVIDRRFVWLSGILGEHSDGVLEVSDLMSDFDSRVQLRSSPQVCSASTENHWGTMQPLAPPSLAMMGWLGLCYYEYLITELV